MCPWSQFQYSLPSGGAVSVEHFSFCVLAGLRAVNQAFDCSPGYRWEMKIRKCLNVRIRSLSRESDQAKAFLNVAWCHHGLVVTSVQLEKISQWKRVGRNVFFAGHPGHVTYSTHLHAKSCKVFRSRIASEPDVESIAKKKCPSDEVPFICHQSFYYLCLYLNKKKTCFIINC